MARPDQQLVGFTRVALEPGESVTVHFEVHPSRLAFFDESMRFVTEPGTFSFAAGGSSASAAAQVTVELSGAVASYNQRDVVATQAVVTRT